MDRAIETLRKILKFIDEGILVRSIAGDGESDWAIKQMPLVLALADAQRLVDEADRGTA